MAEEKGGYIHWIGRPVTISFCVAIVLVALAGSQWLTTEEKIPNSSKYNATSTKTYKRENGYSMLFTKSSLWSLCISRTGLTWNCSSINFFGSGEYNPYVNDSTAAISYTIVKSTPFFIISAVILILSYGIFIMETCSHQHSVYYFISGGLFIISGLLMLSGLIMYISIFKSEVGFKLRTKSSLQPSIFTFHYGQSFYIYALGFICIEMVGVFNVFMYISKVKTCDGKKIYCTRFNSSGNEYYRKRDMNEFGSFDNVLPMFACKRHKRQDSGFESLGKHTKCNLHSQNITKSLNELFENDIDMSVREKDSIFGYPQEFPITRSMSSSTDIYVNNCEMVANEKGKKSALKYFFKGGKAKVTDQDDYEPRKPGRYINPQNIYYIEDNSAGNEGTIYVVESQSNLKNHLSEISIHRSKSYQSNKLFDEPDLDKASEKQFFNSTDKLSSQQRLNSSNRSLHQSRTLPRDFLKRSNQFTDEFFDMRNSHNQYRTNRDYDNTFVHKSIDDFIHLNQDAGQNNQWPKCIPTSPSSVSMKSRNYPNIADVNFRNNIFRQQTPVCPKSILHHVPSTDDFATFDLDQIERERRKSHANLFDYRVKYDNMSTPV
ncbi:uncharacterized protein DMENIID0001_097600 [Sergentomyia squamirostris]